MNEMQVMQILGGIAFNHPQIMSLFAQLKDTWTANQAYANKIGAEYQTAAAGATTEMQIAGVVLELMKAHPNAVPLIVRVLGMIAPHIAETQQTLTQVQSQVMAT